VRTLRVDKKERKHRKRKSIYIYIIYYYTLGYKNTKKEKIQNTECINELAKLAQSLLTIFMEGNSSVRVCGGVWTARGLPYLSGGEPRPPHHTPLAGSFFLHSVFIYICQTIKRGDYIANSMQCKQ